MAGCEPWNPEQTDDDISTDDDIADDDTSDDDTGDDDTGDDDTGDDDTGDDDTGDDDTGDDDTGDDDTGDDDTGDDDTGDDDTGDDDTGDDDDTQAGTDADGDGWTVQNNDCDDNNANIYPGAPELCDGMDNDCDGTVPADENDADGDAYMECAGDCDDGNANVNPGEMEVPIDGLDNDCDGITDPEWLPIWPVTDPSGDANGYLLDIAEHHYRQVGSQISFRTTAHTPFSDNSAMIDMYVNDGTDSWTLTWDNNNPVPEPLQFWSSTNAWAEVLDTPPSMEMDTDTSSTIILGVDLGAMEMGGATEMDAMVGVNLDTGTYDDEYPDNGLVTVPLGPAACLVVDSTNLTQQTGNGDLYVDTGETWYVEVVLRNTGTVSATGVTGILQQAGSALTVTLSSSSFGTINAGNTATTNPSFRFNVGQQAAGTERMELELSGGGESWIVPIDVPIGWGLETAAYEQWGYDFNVNGPNVTGELTVGVLDTNQAEQCYHHFTLTGSYQYGLAQGTWFPDEADETIEIDTLTDSGQGTCPAGYHDLYSVDPSEMIPSTTTVLAYISCDVADYAFHGDDIVYGTGTGTQLSWCNDVGATASAAMGLGGTEGIALMIVTYGSLNGIGTFTYYPSADGNYDWAHMGLIFLGANNTTDPLNGMNGIYEHWVNWVFTI